MSITRSYNKHTDTYYAYDTTYVWDEERQKKIQRRKCIGKYDNNTGELIPTERRGRPTKQIQSQIPEKASESPGLQYKEILSKAQSLSSRIDSLENMAGRIAEDVRGLRQSINALIRQIEEAG